MIIISSLKLVFDTYIDSDAADETNKKLTLISSDLDIFFNIIFAIEAAIKIIAMGFIFNKGSYLTDTHNVLSSAFQLIGLIG